MQGIRRATYQLQWMTGFLCRCPQKGHLALCAVVLDSGLVARLEGSIHQKVVGAIPGQGTYLGSMFDPQSDPIKGSRLMFLSHINVSLSSSL